MLTSRFVKPTCRLRRPPDATRPGIRQRRRWHRALCLTIAVGVLSGCASGYRSTAHTPTSPATLPDAGNPAPLQRLANQGTLGHLQATWPADALPFALLAHDTPRSHDTGVRLMHEITTLRRAARLRGDATTQGALAQWRRVIMAQQDAPRRSRTLPDRDRLPLSELAHWGYCLPPDWIEVWGATGVARQPWTPSLTLAGVAASASHLTPTHAWHVPPQGEPRRHGIAPWNREPVELRPGSRVVVEWPAQQPAMGVNVERHWVNERLPRWLATQLPGDECRSWPQESPQ